jgi:uncharacterized protein (DUF885 family)
MKLTSMLSIRILLLLMLPSLVTACGPDSTAEPVAFEFAETEKALAQSTLAQPTSTQVIPTPTQAEATPEPLSTEIVLPVDEIIAGLEGLPIDQFFEASYSQLLLRNPELLTELNLSEQFGLRNDRLNNLSDAYLRETQKLEAAILSQLRTYDRQSLAPEDRLSYDIYLWLLEDKVQGHEFMYHNYPLNHFINSYDFNLTTLLTELHPLKSREDAEDYIQRLSKVEAQVDQLLEGLTIREQLGILPPDFIIQMARSNLAGYIGFWGGNMDAIEASRIPAFEVFNESLASIPELNAEEVAEFKAAALQQVEESFVPGYLKLIDYLDRIQPLADDRAGVWKLPNGEAYYAYKLRQETSTDLTPEEIHELGLAEVERIRQEMKVLFSGLGYPEDEDFRRSLGRAIQEGSVYDISTEAGKQEFVSEVEQIIAEADLRMGEVFDIGPSWGVEVVPGPMGGYYVAGAPDGSRPGAYHVGVSGQQVRKFTQPTIAYHEAVPGHHYQIATAQALDLPMFRKGAGFNGYVEGWALYAEQLAYEMGLYENDPYGNLGRLQMELLRAVRLVADTGIHANGWTRQEARDYLDQALGAPGFFSHEVDRYIVMPAQATGYKIGMLKILELRQTAEEALGEQFDITEFHNIVIGNGSLPLETLDQLVEAYIAGSQNP